MVRVRAETLEGYVGTSPVFILPRLVGQAQASHRLSPCHLVAGAQTGSVRCLPVPG